MWLIIEILPFLVDAGCFMAYPDHLFCLFHLSYFSFLEAAETRSIIPLQIDD